MGIIGPFRVALPFVLELLPFIELKMNLRHPHKTGLCVPVKTSGHLPCKVLLFESPPPP